VADADALLSEKVQGGRIKGGAKLRRKRWFQVVRAVEKRLEMPLTR
jgi:hypothetical protein